MAHSDTGRPHAVVVGGGISGLTAAYRLAKSVNGRPIDVTLLEASDRLGGKLLTVEAGGVRVEAGADSFVVRKPWAVELCKELGLGGELIVPASSGAYVWTRKRLVPYPQRVAFGIPASSFDLLRWPGLSFPARLRAATEFLHRVRRSEADESIGGLVTRRMGPEAARVLVGPLLAGLHAGDMDRLSVQATFPELVSWERGHEGLIRGSRLALKAARRATAAKEGTVVPGRVFERDAMFATVWGGLSRLVETMEAAIGTSRIRRDTPVTAVRSSRQGLVVEAGGESFPADAIVFATPAFETGRLLSDANPEAARVLTSVPYASTAVVILVYPAGTGAALPDGTGFVVPAGEGVVTACTWLSRKWPQGDDGDRAILRCFVGRAGAEEALGMSDDDLTGKVRQEVEVVAPPGAAPDAALVVRWNRSMPQYEVGHLELLSKLDAALDATPGIFVAGSAYRGVGIADCVRQGGEAATRARDFLGVPTGQHALETNGPRREVD